MEDVIIERKLFGDVLRPSRNFDNENVIPGATPSNRISVVADDIAPEDVYAIRFVEWKGILWSVKGVSEERPRLVLSLGEVYNGPVAPTDNTNN